MAELNITLADGRSSTHTLAGHASEVVGRDPTCEIWVDDPGTSRRHARFTRTPQGFQVEDLGSRNGTAVNGHPVRTHLLKNGDVLTFGTVRVEYHDAAPPSPRSSVILTEDEQSTESRSYSRKARGPLHLPQKRLQVIYDLSDRLTRVRDQDALLADALDVCFEMLHFERGAIAIRNADGKTVDWPVVRHLRGREGELTVSRSALGRALDHGEYVIITEDKNAGADPTVSMVQLGIRSAMCVPLMYEDQVLGVIYGDRTSTAAVYSQEDADFLAGIARQVSIGLINARLLEEQRLKIQLEKDIALAREIQTGLFPRALPSRDEVKVAAVNEPGNRVSGDYYDVIELPGGRICALIADVTGEGVAASLLMANLQAAVRVTIEDSDDPAGLLTRWNRLMYRNTGASKFITALVLMVDPAERSIRVASAGHHLPYLIRPAVQVPSVNPTPPADQTPPADAPRSADPSSDADSRPHVEPILAEPGFPLGVMEHAAYTTHASRLGGAPCGVFCYTDGVIEARSPDDTLFGEAMLEASLGRTDPRHPAGIVEAVRSAVADFRDTAPRSDDITMLAISLL